VDTDESARYDDSTMPKEEQQSNKRLKSTTVRIQAHADATASAAIRPRLVPDIEES
jgi:hypothetical protein